MVFCPNNTVHDAVYLTSIKASQCLSKIIVFIMRPILAIPHWLSGWSYSALARTFYPLNLENSRWLSYYSQVFDFSKLILLSTGFLMSLW